MIQTQATTSQPSICSLKGQTSFSSSLKYSLKCLINPWHKSTCKQDFYFLPSSLNLTVQCLGYMQTVGEKRVFFLQRSVQWQAKPFDECVAFVQKENSQAAHCSRSLGKIKSFFYRRNPSDYARTFKTDKTHLFKQHPTFQTR